MQTITENPSQSSMPGKPASPDLAHLRRVRKVLRKRTFATLASVSPAGRPHVAGVIYEWVDGALWVHTMRNGRKGRNVADNPHVAVCVPFRRLPVGPPFTLHFQATAEIVAMDDPRVVALLDAGRLKKISGHGALEIEDACFLKIRPAGRVHTFGYGVPVLDMARDPLHGDRMVDLRDAEVAR